jgi:hypothetical protein
VVANVPEVGKVTVVSAVRVPVKLWAPENVTFPPMVIMLVELLTPVPPNEPGNGTVFVLRALFVDI